jgi:glucose-6-phosphate dehydrogenase assembly protein OpcA
VSKINRSLKRLWEQDAGVLTRASLINFAVYSEASDALNFNTELMAEVTREHACRVILLAADPLASRQRVRAWISAHCHVTHAGARQVCSEQVAFLIEGGGQAVMRNILFSNLDSDLPLYLWWQGQFSPEIDSQLWNWVDRLFFDSQGWREPGHQIQILLQSAADCRSRTVLCDLNWRRLIYLRLALAQIFDHPWGAEKLRQVREIEIAHHPEYRTTAVLLVSWFARQLGWELDGADFIKPGAGEQVQVKLLAIPGPWISRVRLGFPAGTVNVVWSGNFLETTLSDHVEIKQMLPAGGTSLPSLVKEELMRGGEHRTYLAALGFAERLWGRV